MFCYIVLNSFNGVYFHDKETIEEMMEFMKISKASVTRGIKTLLENGFMKKKSRGKYEINPEYAWRGNLVNRGNIIGKVKYKVSFAIYPDEELYDYDKEELNKLLNE